MAGKRILTAVMAPFTPGQTFGPFVVEGVVGVGGMGVVYRARETSRGVPVALKVLRLRDGAPPTDEDRARFVREARLAAGLVHPYIVKIVASGAVGTVPYIAMEWVDGASLAVRMDGAMPLGVRLDILAGVADALAHAHANGVVHRDLKPTNVMIDLRGMPKLVDFGIAKQARDASQPFALAHTEAGIPLATRTGVLLGTPSYMAPEQMLSPEVDARVDQFAWGVLAYELLAGVHPRDTIAAGDAAFPVGRARPLAWQAPEVPEPVAAVVHRAMAYERDARFATMNDVAMAFHAARNAHASGAVAGRATDRTGPALLGSAAPLVAPVAPTVATTMEGMVRTDSTPRAQAKPAVLAVLAAATFMTLGGGYVACSRTPASPVPPVPIPGIRTIELTSRLDDIPFEGGEAGVAKAKAEVHGRLRPCIDNTMQGEDMISVDIEIGTDGKVTTVGVINYCRREYGNHYLCTELGDPVKKGHPTPPVAMLTCVKTEARKLAFPQLMPRRTERHEPAKMPEPTSTTLDLEAR